MERGKHILQKITVRKIRGTAGFDYSDVGAEHAYREPQEKRILCHEKALGVRKLFKETY